MVLNDIQTTKDIAKIMDIFYDQLLVHPVAGPVFAHVDMQAHMPRVVAFWESVVLGGQHYTGSPFQRHVPLNLTSEHFSIWFETFCSSIEDNFQGPNATLMKDRAHSIALLFAAKLNLDPPQL